MTRSFYTVSLVTFSGDSQVSRFFNTVAAARKWATFLLSTNGVSQVCIYRGEAGGELIERRAVGRSKPGAAQLHLAA